MATVRPEAARRTQEDRPVHPEPCLAEEDLRSRLVPEVAHRNHLLAEAVRRNHRAVPAEDHRIHHRAVGPEEHRTHPARRVKEEIRIEVRPSLRARRPCPRIDSLQAVRPPAAAARHHRIHRVPPAAAAEDRRIHPVQAEADLRIAPKARPEAAALRIHLALAALRSHPVQEAVARRVHPSAEEERPSAHPAPAPCRPSSP